MSTPTTPGAPGTSLLDRLLPSWKEARTKLAERRVPVLTTPSTWGDTGGLYLGPDGGWLYFDLPATILADDGTLLDQLLRHSHDTLGGRRIHLLCYGWEGPVVVPVGTPAALGDYMTRALRLIVPGSLALLGVRLTPDPAALRRSSRLWPVALEVVDRALGEWVPDLSIYEQDRELVHTFLERFGATPVAGAGADMLESWHTLGVARDVTAVERDEAIRIGADTVELVSVRSFLDPAEVADAAADSPLTTHATPRQAPEGVATYAAGPGGTTVVSVRAETRPAVPGKPAQLRRASILVGRRSSSAPDVLEKAVQMLPGVEVKPLPLAQLPALDETLPTSPNTLNPHLHRVGALELRRLGFCQDSGGGDPAGVLLGMSSTAFAAPRYLAPLPGRAVAIWGRSGAGKTFLAENIATQVGLGGRHTVWLTSSGGAAPAGVGAHLATLPTLRGQAREVRVGSETAAGTFDPYTHLHPREALVCLMALVRAGLPHLPAEGFAHLERSLERAVGATLPTVTAALRQVTEPRLAAELVRFFRSPAGRPFSLPEAGPAAHPAAHPGRQSHVVWDVDAVLGAMPHAALRAAALDTVLACAEAVAADGLLVVDDLLDHPDVTQVSGGLGGWAPGTAAQAARSALSGQGRAATLLVTSSSPDLAGAAPMPAFDVEVVLAHDLDRDASPIFAAAGRPCSAALRDWLAVAAPVLVDGVVEQTALGVTWHRGGQSVGLAVGPVPLSDLPLLTRGAASVYLADLAFG